MNVLVTEEEIPNGLQGAVMLTPFQDASKISILCDSKANTHIIPWLQELTASRTVN